MKKLAVWLALIVAVFGYALILEQVGLWGITYIVTDSPFVPKIVAVYGLPTVQLDGRYSTKQVTVVIAPFPDDVYFMVGLSTSEKDWLVSKANSTQDSKTLLITTNIVVNVYAASQRIKTLKVAAMLTPDRKSLLVPFSSLVEYLTLAYYLEFVVPTNKGVVSVKFDVINLIDVLQSLAYWTKLLL